MASRPSNKDKSIQGRFQGLLEDHWRIVLKVTNTYTRSSEDRRDLAQEISYQLWRAFPGYDEQRSFSTWMYRIALNVAISYARTTGLRERRTVPMEAKHEELLSADPTSPEALDRAATLDRFMEGLAQLDRALLLLYLEEHSYLEIAEILGISETNVATKISRLKRRFRDESEDGEEHGT